MTKLLETNSLEIRPEYSFFMMSPRFEVTADGQYVGQIVREAWGDFAIDDAEAGRIGRVFRPYVWMRTRVEVSDFTGPIGRVQQTTYMGRLQFAFLDQRDEMVAEALQDGWGAAEFRIAFTNGVRVGELTREYRFWRSGDYRLTFAPDTPVQMRLFSLALVVAVDAAIQRRRRN